MSVHVADHHFAGLQIHDTISHRTLDMREAFSLVLKDNTQLRSSDMHVTALPSSIIASDPHRSLRDKHEDAPLPASSCWNFTSPSTTATFDWCLIVRPGSNYARTLLRINATTQDLPLTEVRLLNFSDPNAHVDGIVASRSSWLEPHPR